MNIPTSLRAGDTWSWKDTVSGYQAGALPTDWVLKYHLRGKDLTSIDIVSTADGTDHAISVTADESSSFTPGSYVWAAYVERTVTGVLERHTVGSGDVDVLPFLRQATSADDFRSHARKTLAAIDAVMEGRASVDQEQITIAGRSLVRTPMADLIKLRQYYEQQVDAEEAAERIAKGLSGKKRILTRFGG